MKLLTFLKFLWDNRKGTEYVLRTGKIPLCECKEYIKTSDCIHMEEARKYIKKFKTGSYGNARSKEEEINIEDIPF